MEYKQPFARTGQWTGFVQKGSEREGPDGATQTKIFYIPSNQGLSDITPVC